MNDIFVARLCLPPAVKGAVLPAPEGDYQVIINDTYPPAQQREIYSHELRHLLLGHLYGGPALADAERTADEKDLLLGQIRVAERQGLPLLPLILHTPPPASRPAPPSAFHRLHQLVRAQYTNCYY